MGKRKSELKKKGGIKMNLGVPQIIVLALMMIGVGFNLAVHGNPKTGNESFFTSLVSNAIMFSLLYWGGFFR